MLDYMLKGDFSMLFGHGQFVLKLSDECFLIFDLLRQELVLLM